MTTTVTLQLSVNNENGTRSSHTETVDVGDHSIGMETVASLAGIVFEQFDEAVHEAVRDQLGITTYRGDRPDMATDEEGRRG